MDRGRRVILLACSLGLAAAGPACMSMVQGVGPVLPPTDEGGAHLALAAGGGQQQGIVQGTLGVSYQAADWFALDLSFVVNGVYASFDHDLRRAQGLTMNWGLWPVISGTFYIGPVDLRLSLFGIGGGGPEGPGGYMGYAAGTLGLRIDDVRALWAGFSAQAVDGCCETNYDGVSYQVPVGLVIGRVPFGSDSPSGWIFALEMIWQRDTVKGGGVDEVHADTVSLLLHVIADWMDI